ncbi:hypothetical protein LO80_07925 [Candidatus Francisella endociliophora]|uniref:AB hydrolase-1 domain-containing protein n=1 Tax=Candidatus Francisella endociliophora TaxID=653937 RepID=A0A097EQS4_9GAMM|nr:alpha/beta hydrolase [Francisella sp. FSC1006]AIT09901.1 hypothetical protein LO80_07925 [Francisella sp. FSC1006]
MRKLITVLFFLVIASLGYSVNLESKTIDISNDIDIHYLQSTYNETKPNLIMLTGRGTTANFWPKDFIDNLAKSYNLYLLDYRNINTDRQSTKENYSISDMAEDVNTFATKASIYSPSLLGWSMGGAVALEASFEHPEEYSHLILLSPALPKTSTQKIPPAPAFKTTDDIYNYVFSINLYDYSKENLNAEKNRFINSEITKLFPSNEVLAKQITGVTKWRNSDDNLKKFKNIEMPIYIYVSLDDKVERVNEIKDTIAEVKNKKNITAKYFKNAGHAIAWDKSQELANAINKLA